MNLHLNIEPEFSLLQSLEKQMGIVAEGNRLALPEMMGKGQLSHFPFPGGFQFNLFDFQLKFPMKFTTVNPPDSGAYNLILNPDGTPLEKQFADKAVALDGDGEGQGIFFQSPGTPAVMAFHPGIPYRFANLLFTQETILPYFPDQSPLLPFLNQTGLHLFEEWDVRVEQQAFAILTEAAKDQANQLWLHGQLLQVLQFFFQQVLQREQGASVSSIPAAEVASLMKVRHLLKQQLERKPPSIPELARVAGMSESKLKRLFKQFFGKSLHQYARYARMLHAQRLFHTQHYNISEVADAVGYNNLSHFGEAFQKQFGLKPGAYLRSHVG